MNIERPQAKYSLRTPPIGFLRKGSALAAIIFGVVCVLGIFAVFIFGAFAVPAIFPAGIFSTAAAGLPVFLVVHKDTSFCTMCTVIVWPEFGMICKNRIKTAK